MRRFIYDQHQAIAQFVALRVPHCRRGFGAKITTLGITAGEGEQETLIGGVVYHNYDPDAGIIEISGASDTPTWLTRNVIRRIFDYPFLEAQVQMVIMRTREDNVSIARILRAYGFKTVDVPRMFGRYVDGLLCTLTDDDWAHNRFNAHRNLQRDAEGYIDLDEAFDPELVDLVAQQVAETRISAQA